MSKVRLKDIIKNKEPFMEFLIDEDIKKDDEGNWRINVGYIRVSTDKQAEKGFGLDVQRDDVLKQAKRDDLTNLLLIVDDGYSGTTMNRPGINFITKMINDFNEDKINIRINMLIVPKIDRLSRSLLGTLQFIQDYIVAAKDSKNSSINKNKYDIYFTSVAEKYCRIEEDNPQSKFLLMLFATLAEFDRDLIVKKMMDGKKKRLESGLWKGGGNQPFGYHYNKEKGVLEIVPEEAEKLREVFRLYIDEHMSTAAIAKTLGFKGERIVLQILNRKLSAGYIVSETYDIEVKGKHEPIITLERWLEAQEEIERRRKKNYTTGVHMLSGLIYCGECGARMRYINAGKDSDGANIFSLYCYSRDRSKPHLHGKLGVDCPNRTFKASEVEEAVISELFEFSHIANSKVIKEVSENDVLGKLEKQLAKEEMQLEALFDSFDSLTGVENAFDNAVKKRRDKIVKIKKQISDEKKNKLIQNRIKNNDRKLRSIQSEWSDMTDSERKEICRQLIKKVTIFENGGIRVEVSENSFVAQK